MNWVEVQNKKNEKQALSQANSVSYFNKIMNTITQDEQTEERFVGDTANSQPNSVINGDKFNH